MKLKGVRVRPGWIVGLLLALFWGMAVSVTPRVGLTADESGHLTAGYSYWRFNDYRLNPENGTLPMRIAALPLLAMELDFPSLESDAWRRSSAVGVADEFFFFRGNPVERMLFAGRAAVALVGVFTVWLIWRWARGLFGAAGGWMALGFAVFCPALLAHGGLATSDMAVTACFLAALSAMWRLLHRVTWLRLAMAAVACGALFLAKMSGVLIVPLIAGMLALRWCVRAPLRVELAGLHRAWLRRRGAVIGATSALTIPVAAGSLVVLWGGYGFRFDGFNRQVSRAEGYFFSWDVVLERERIPWKDDSALAKFVTPHREPAETRWTQLIDWVREKRLLPEAFLWGCAHTLKFAAERPAFFRGEFSKTGWKAFFPTAFVMKTPAPALVAFAAGVLAVLIGGRRRAPAIERAGRRRRRWLYRAGPLLLFFAAYWALALNMRLNIGHRHILPIYPIVYVFAGASVLWIGFGRKSKTAVVLVGLLALQAIESVRSRPFYLAFFEPLFGGPERAYRWFVDSSLDWGQGLPDLAAWEGRRRAAGDRAPLFISYAGVDLPRRHGIVGTRFGDEHYDLDKRSYPAPVRGGWFAISATHFQRIYLPVRGAWTAEHEALYGEINRRLAQPVAGDAANRAQRLRDARDYELLQFGRLCHFLENRPPDEIVGASILLFRLSDAEVELALYAPLEHVKRARATRALPVQ